MKIFLSFCFLAAFCPCSFSQNYQSLDTVKTYGDYENIYLRKLYSDSLASSFVLFIRKEVKAHKHLTHSEHLYFLEGEGEMSVGDKSTEVKSGNMVFIPKGTVHSLKVTSSTPVKVLSVQSPLFDGKDRVLVE